MKRGIFIYLKHSWKKINKATEMYSYPQNLLFAPKSKPLRVIQGGNSTGLKEWEISTTFPRQF